MRWALDSRLRGMVRQAHHERRCAGVARFPPSWKRHIPILCILFIPVSCDTRPFRGRPAIAYAGCMTVVRTAAIDSAYSSGPSHRCGLWVRRPTFQIDEHLVQLLLEAGHGPVQGGARCSRCSDRALGLLVAPAARCSDSGAGCTPCSRPLDSSLRWNDGCGRGMVRQAHHERPALQRQRAHHERPVLGLWIPASAGMTGAWGCEVPASAGTTGPRTRRPRVWIPAFAGMTGG